MKESIVRVGVSNNFNCSDPELGQLEDFKTCFPTKKFFINSNLKTENIRKINDHDVKSVITVNPDIIVDFDLLTTLFDIDKSKISFLRVKYIPQDHDILKLIKMLCDKDYKVVFTIQRFASKQSIKKYSDPEFYKWECSWHRLKSEYFKDIKTLQKKHKGMLFICDEKGKGCSGCSQCATLTYGKIAELESLNLSTSGVCAFDCPDCYAKKMQKFLVACDTRPIQFDVIKANNKQKGATKHIQNSK